MSNLLCIDFDFFFPNAMEAGDFDDPTWPLTDWGHAESPLFLSGVIWESRAAAFYQMNLPLPPVLIPEGGWSTFWARFQFADDTVFTFGDSNAHAGLIAPPDGSPAFESVLLFDAHHDSGYQIDAMADYLAQTTFNCEDWVLEQQQRGTSDLSVRYPTWKPNGPTEDLPAGVLTRQSLDDGAPVPTVFDAVYVCRSGAWVPPWCDTDFLNFVNAAPMDGEQVDEVELVRDFNAAQAQQMGQLFAATHATLIAGIQDGSRS